MSPSDTQLTYSTVLCWISPDDDHWHHVCHLNVHPSPFHIYSLSKSTRIYIYLYLSLALTLTPLHFIITPYIKDSTVVQYFCLLYLLQTSSPPEPQKEGYRNQKHILFNNRMESYSILSTGTVHLARLGKQVIRRASVDYKIHGKW